MAIDEFEAAVPSGYKTPHAFIPVRGVLAEPEGEMVADLPQDSLAHATAPGHPSNGDRDFSGTLIRRVRPDGVRT